eukprot:g19919.t2
MLRPAFALSLWGFHAYELLWRLQLRPFSWVDWEHLRESAKEAQRAAMRSWDELDALQCLLLCGFWTVLLGPVPFTRVILGDHSVEQVMIGSIVGLSSSLTVWMAARALQKSHNHQLDEDWRPALAFGAPRREPHQPMSLLKCCGEHRLIRHNMALPLSSVRRRLQRGTPEPARRELQWYIDKLSAEIDRSDARPYAKHRFKENNAGKPVTRRSRAGQANRAPENTASKEPKSRGAGACLRRGSHFPVDRCGEHWIRCVRWMKGAV